MNVLLSLDDYTKLIEDYNNIKKDLELKKSILEQKDLEIQQLKNQLDNLKSQESLLVSRFISLKNEVQKFKENPFGDNYQKSFYSYKHEKTRSNLRRHIKNVLIEYSNKLRLSLGLSISKVELTDDQVETPEIIYLEKLNNQEKNFKENYFHLLIKDILHISDNAWNLLKIQLELDLDSLESIRQMRRRLNNDFILNKCYNGYFIDPKQEIENKTKEFIKSSNCQDKIIKIKISADGTILSRNIKIINLVFSIINEKKKAATATGTYLLGIFPYKKESNFEINQWLPTIWDQLKDLKNVKVEELFYDIKFYFSADYKMMLNILGMKSANSNSPCIWCDTNKLNLHERGIDRIENFDQTIQANASNSVPTTSKDSMITDDFYDDDDNEDDLISDKNCYTRMLPEIPIKNFVVDILHLFLRITERLGHCLLQDFLIADNFIKSEFYTQSKHMNITRLIGYLTENCKIRVLNLKYTYSTIDSIFTRMQGPEKIKLLQCISKDNSFLELLNNCNINNSERKVFLWKTFFKIINDVKNENFPYDISLICRNWLFEFIFCYGRAKITPYIHVFSFHLSEQIKSHGNLSYYDCQGLEKFNDLSTRVFFQSTNKKDWVKQMLLKHLRINKVSAIIKFKPKRIYTKKNDEPEIDQTLEQNDLIQQWTDIINNISKTSNQSNQNPIQHQQNSYIDSSNQNPDEEPKNCKKNGKSTKQKKADTLDEMISNFNTSKKRKK